MNAPHTQRKTLFASDQCIKVADRKRLAELESGRPQAEVDAVLANLRWTIRNPAELAWPRDLDDQTEDPN